MKTKDLTYKVKCRSCNKITKMFFAQENQISNADFQKWANEHSTFPIEQQCDCDNGSIMFHDLISYKLLF